MKNTLLKVSKIGNLILTWFNFLMFFAMRPCWSGISKTLQYEETRLDIILNLPVIIWILLFFIAISNTVLYFISKKDKYSLIYNIVNFIFLIAIIVIIILGAIDYMSYIWVNFFNSLLVVAIILALVFFIFVYPNSKLANSKVFKFSTLGVICCIALSYMVNFSFNDIKTGAVVYAVENDYQIVFSSQTNSRAFVKIGNETIYENYNGSNKSYSKIHKITVPMTKLNEAKQYQIGVQKITYRGPFGGYKGRVITQTYNFRPVDTSDGDLKYYSLADIHMAKNASVQAASYLQDKELLVLAGDIVSMMDTFADANLVNVYANAITKGEIAVVYARGNHEIKGRYSEYFHQFVGTSNDKFYYNFYLDGVYGVVLDMGEDHEDNYWEYYKTSYYDAYRDEQINFLKKEVESKNFENYKYKLAVCHIPIVYINSRGDHRAKKEAMVEYLNQMDIDMMISGHQHDLFVFEPESAVKSKSRILDHNFLNLLVSKRGYEQYDSDKLTNKKSQIGLATIVDFNKNIQTCIYNNSKLDKVSIKGHYSEIEYGTDLVFDLESKKHIEE